MTLPESSPLDNTPPSKVRAVVVAVVVGMAVAFAVNPGSVGRWGYMLSENAWNRPVIVVAQRIAAFGTEAYTHFGVAVPFDAVAKAGTWLRSFVPANPDVVS